MEVLYQNPHGYFAWNLFSLLHLQFPSFFLFTCFLSALLLLFVILSKNLAGQLNLAFNRHYIYPEKMNLAFSTVFASAQNNTVANSQSQVSSSKIKVAIFASGAGSNAQKIIDHFRNSQSVKIALIVCNKPDAKVLQIAGKENIPSLLIEKERFLRGDGYIDEFRKESIGFIVLAGFLWKIPATILRSFPHLIINIHPALLPKYGGKGMYGQFVHEAVIAAGEKESGITIHYVDEIYDHGQIIFQAKCAIAKEDTAETLAQNIHQLEHLHYPQVIEKLLDELAGTKK
jgi:phosphoribosylglycinamide formyltransferase-1